MIDETGNLTNAGALLAYESPVRHSRLFCTRWNGLTKASELGISIATVKLKIKKMPNVSYKGSGYSDHWEIKE